jgi:hypothetical protein
MSLQTARASPQVLAGAVRDQRVEKLERALALAE